MKLIRIILFPIVPVYYVITSLRNYLYQKGVKSSKTYNLPIICVGNLSTGGTGKTPMIEYLIRLLKDNKSLATLSRGYKRVTEGYILADKSATADTIGDEPYQFFRKFKNIRVAVDTNRQHGINKLLSLHNQPDVILLDDAYQHRKVNAGLNILLTAYYNLYCDDIVLPTGTLREPKSGATRAAIIVVTKCPSSITALEKKQIASRLKIKPQQKLFFSTIAYDDFVISKTSQLALQKLQDFTLVTGIANAKPLVDFLHEQDLHFEHLEYPDHYSFKPSDIELLATKGLLITTEKDYVRLSGNENLIKNLFYLPISLSIENKDVFDKAIREFVN